MKFLFFKKVVVDESTGRTIRESAMLPSFCMYCGPSGMQESEAGQAESLSNSISSMLNERFAQQSNVLSQIQSQISPIASAGPSQQGWSPSMAAAVNTATINNAAAAARNATQATQGALAGRGGDSGLESGVDQQIIAGIKSNAADTLANQQTANTIANYKQGNQNWLNAQQFQGALAGYLNPTPYGGEAINANSSAFNQSTTVQNEKNQEESEIAGAITGPVLSAATGGLSNLDTTGGSTFMEQLGNFASGAA